MNIQHPNDDSKTAIKKAEVFDHLPFQVGLLEIALQNESRSRVFNIAMAKRVSILRTARKFEELKMEKDLLLLNSQNSKFSGLIRCRPLKDKCLITLPMCLRLSSRK